MVQGLKISVYPDQLFSSTTCNSSSTHRIGGNRKRSQQSTNTDRKSLETVLSKILFLTIFDLRSSIVLHVRLSIAAYPVCSREFLLKKVVWTVPSCRLQY